MIYKRLLRPVLFKMDPETAKDIAETALSVPFIWRAVLPFSECDLTTQLTPTLSVPSPVGAAAGLDKNAHFLGSLLDLGFGFAAGGTFTKDPRKGNPKPRMERRTSERALVNSLGFPNEGSEKCAENMRKFAKTSARLLASVSGETEDDILECVERFAPLSAAIELNISSPNTAGIRVFQKADALKSLVESVCAEKTAQIFVKLPPWEDELKQTQEHVKLGEAALEAGASGLVIANTRPIVSGKLHLGRGGLSGAPLFESTKRMVAEMAARLGKGTPIIACGGVSDAKNVWELLSLGASAVELYTAMIYEGPLLAMRINIGLSQLMRAAGISKVSDISGEPPKVDLTSPIFTRFRRKIATVL